MNLLSIIVVTHNSIAYIGRCLDSVFDQGFRGVEVIVVDNGSRDGTVGLLKDKYAGITLIENSTNLGACKGRNQGIGAARGEWVLTLDCDIVLKQDFLFRFANISASLPPATGSLQPKIMQVNSNVIYSKGIHLSFLRRFFDISRGKIDERRFDLPTGVFGVCSAAAFYRRKMLEDIKEDTGYFDERFFFLVEDVDLSWRAVKKGWKSVFFPDSICYHSGNSSGCSPILRRYLCFRNRLYTILKNESLSGKICLIPVFCCYDLVRSLYLYFNRNVIRRQLSGLCQ